MHVLCELAQELGEGRGLFENNIPRHLLHRVRLQTDASSPGRRRGEETETVSRTSVEIEMFHFLAGSKANLICSTESFCLCDVLQPEMLT